MLSCNSTAVVASTSDSQRARCGGKTSGGEQKGFMTTGGAGHSLNE